MEIQNDHTDEDLDGTDYANPAYYRGQDHCLRLMCFKINQILDGKDDGRGVSNEPWESTRRRLLELVNAKTN